LERQTKLVMQKKKEKQELESEKKVVNKGS